MNIGIMFSFILFSVFRFNCERNTERVLNCVPFRYTSRELILQYFCTFRNEQPSINRFVVLGGNACAYFFSHIVTESKMEHM